MYFQVTLEKVLMSLIFIIPGYIALKTKLVNADHSKTLSAILLYVCSPGLIINSFMVLDFTVEGLINMGWFFLATAVAQLAFLVILKFVFIKKSEDAKFRVINIAAVCSNMGYFGMPIVQAVFPNNPEVLSYTSVFVITMNVILFTIGIYFLTGKKEYMTVKKAFINPASLSFFVGIAFYLVGAKNFMPSVVSDCISSLGAMCTPLSMLILGIRLATMDFKKLFTSGSVYLASALKLIAYPLFAYLLVYFLPLDAVFKGTILVLSATPIASSVLNIAEMYKSEEEMSANCVMVSTLLSAITLPLLTLIL